MQKIHLPNKMAKRKGEVRFVGVTFDEEKIHQGEFHLNYLLAKDFFIMKSYQTQTGVVYELGRSRK